jgi:hypothetical protein
MDKKQIKEIMAVKDPEDNIDDYFKFKTSEFIPAACIGRDGIKNSYERKFHPFGRLGIPFR